MIDIKSVESVAWINIFDKDIDWTEDKLANYQDLWPNYETEIPEGVSVFYLRSLTQEQLEDVEKKTGFEKFLTIVKYGLVDFTNIYENGKPVKIGHVKTPLGDAVNTSILQKMLKIGVARNSSELSMLSVLSVQILKISRSV